MFDDFFVLHGAGAVQYDNDQIASTSNCYDLSTSTFSVLCTFDDTRQIEQLYLSSFISKDTRNTGKSCELICCYFWECSWVMWLVPVSLVRRVDLPTEGNPIIPTRASPDFDTSKPYPPTPPFLPPAGSMSSLLSLANLALSNPKW